MRNSERYSSDFIEKCFITWYSMEERPADYNAIAKILPPDESGRRPARATVQKWYIEYGWGQRADELDSKALAIVENSLITKKAALLQKQAEDAFLLAGKSHAFLMSGTFDSSAAAVNAYFRATEEVRNVVGLSDLLKRLGQMSDEDIQEEIKRRLLRASEAGQIIDADEELVDGDTDQETS